MWSQGSPRQHHVGGIPQYESVLAWAGDFEGRPGALTKKLIRINIHAQTMADVTQRRWRATGG